MSPVKATRAADILVLLLSVIASIAIAEAVLRIIYPGTVTMSQMYPAYTVDGVRTTNLHMFQRDDAMIFRLKRNYRATYQPAWYPPVPYTVVSDEFGFRNERAGRSYDNVLVGDSVAFGYGVGQQSTITHYLGQRESTYSLALPSAGPNMYILMMEEFLDRADTKRISVLFFSNDFSDIMYGDWDGADECMPPTAASGFRRRDLPPPSQPALVFFRSPLNRSYLAAWLARLSAGGAARDDADTYTTYSALAEVALGDLSFVATDRTAELYNDAMLALTGLSGQKRCLDAPLRSDLMGLTSKVLQRDFDGYPEAVERITRSYIDKACFPVSKDGRNLVMVLYNTKHLYGKSLDIARYPGNIRNMIAYIESIRPLRPGIADDLGQLAELLKNIRRSDEYFDRVYKTHQRISESLGASASGRDKPDTCDRMEMFVKYFASRGNDKRDVDIYFMPEENTLRYGAFTGRGDNKVPDGIKALGERVNRLRDAALRHGVAFHDLTPVLAEHYSHRDANSLYIDGVHLSEEGGRLIAEAMLLSRGAP